MRWLAIDSGEVRVGLAISDVNERVVVPLEIIPANVAFPAIRSIIDREQVSGVLIGLPLLPSGDEGEAAVRARRLGNRIARSLDIKLVYEDESYTTQAANARDREIGCPKGETDDLAAVILLEQFLKTRLGHSSCEE